MSGSKAKLSASKAMVGKMLCTEKVCWRNGFRIPASNRQLHYRLFQCRVPRKQHNKIIRCVAHAFNVPLPRLCGRRTIQRFGTEPGLWSFKCVARALTHGLPDSEGDTPSTDVEGRSPSGKRAREEGGEAGQARGKRRRVEGRGAGKAEGAPRPSSPSPGPTLTDWGSESPPPRRYAPPPGTLWSGGRGTWRRRSAT